MINQSIPARKKRTVIETGFFIISAIVVDPEPDPKLSERKDPTYFILTNFSGHAILNFELIALVLDYTQISSVGDPDPMFFASWIRIR
jgi:hypothetical protein